MGVFEFFTRIGNIVYLSFLWFIGCLPVFTIGASTTAYCYMLRKILEKHEGYITRGYINAFKDNFKDSTKVWLVLFAILILFIANIYIVANMIANFSQKYIYLMPLYVILLILLWGVLIFIFPYMARFNDSPFIALKNSFLISTRYLGFTIVMMIIDAIILGFAFGIFLLAVLVTPALIGVINMAITNVVFKHLND